MNRPAKIDTLSFSVLGKLRFAPLAQVWKDIANDFLRVEAFNPSGGRRLLYRSRATGKELEGEELVAYRKRVGEFLRTPEAQQIIQLTGFCPHFDDGGKVITETALIPGDDPAVAVEGIESERISHYRQIIESRNDARLLLILHARDEKIDPSGGISLGKLRIDEKTLALNAAGSWKSLKVRIPNVPAVIYRAALQNDVKFFKQLGRALESKTPRLDVDWSRVGAVPCFLVDFWVDAGGYPCVPPLCLLSNKALATFCTVALAKRPDDPETTLDAIRKSVSRLKLKRLNSPRIREVRGDGSESPLCFI